jgi:hypothetical protein
MNKMRLICITVIAFVCAMGFSEAQGRGAPLHFNIPASFHGTAAKYLDRYPLGDIQRPLTEAERKRLKALFLWAGAHDNPRRKGPYHYIHLKAPLYCLLVREFPATDICMEEWGKASVENIAYVLRHNLTPHQAAEWRNREAEQLRLADIPRHLPGYKFPSNALDHEFNVSKYISTYPVKRVDETLDEAGKQKLVRFLQEAERLEIKKGFLGGIIEEDCSVMKLVRTNFPATKPLKPTARSFRVKEVLDAMKRSN